MPIDDENDHVELVLEHYKATNSVSSFIQYALKLCHYLESVWETYKPQCLALLQPMPLLEIEAKLARLKKMCMTSFSTAKRDKAAKKHLAQTVEKKTEEFRMAGITEQAKVNLTSSAFLAKQSREFANHRKKHGENIAAWVTDDGNMSPKLKLFLYAVRNSFMYNCAAQRRGQYTDLKRKEFYIQLRKKETAEKVETFECLDYMDKIGEGRAVSLKDFAIKENKDEYMMTLARIPTKPDKKLREKDTAWVEWEIPQEKMKCVMNYFYKCLPLLEKLAQQQNLPWNTDTVFPDSRTFRQLPEAVCLTHMVTFWNYHADNLGINKLEKTSSANFWRHTYATSEFEKWETKQAYRDCRDANEAAAKIAIKMNSSATEVLETYSTRSNVGGRKVGDAAPKQFDYSDSSSGEEEEFDMDFTSNPKTPPAASVAKKRQHLLVDSSDSSDSEDLRPRKKAYSK